MLQNNIKKHFAHIKIVAVCGTFAAGCSTVLNLVFGSDFSPSIVPYTQILSPAINFLTTIASIIVFFLPNSKKIIFTTLFIQSIYNAMTGFETIGIMLYSFLLLLMFCWGYFKKNFKKKAIIMLSIWFFSLMTVIPFGLDRFIFAIGITFLSFSTYICLYDILHDQLNFLIDKVSATQHNCSLNLPETGGTLDLNELNLSCRQIKCIKYITTTDMTYKEIAEKIIISESAVKRDMQDLFKLFGVKNKENLRLLLLQYTLLY